MKNTVREALKKAWETVKEDSYVIESLIEETENECGVRPDPDDVKKFLDGVLTQGETTTKLSEESASSSPSRGPRRRSPTSMTFLGTEHWISAWKDVIVILAKVLIQEHPERFMEESGIGGLKRNYMRNTKTGMSNPDPIGRVGETW